MDTEYKVVEKLIEKGYHITFAESCTAGLAAARLVNVPDASKVLDVSFVTYADEAKQKYVGVKEETIAENGVVSEEVAGEMAAGAAYAMEAEVGVGITGVAGPTGGTETKPVGMVCFGFYIDGQITTYTMQFGDLGRNNVRRSSVDFCYDKLIELLDGGSIC
ncbi:MAG: CinA family protein [Eubacterium sp.]|nr:CinA family protein [Eubacterium sp.]